MDIKNYGRIGEAIGVLLVIIISCMPILFYAGLTLSTFAYSYLIEPAMYFQIILGVWLGILLRYKIKRRS